MPNIRVVLISSHRIASFVKNSRL